MLEGKTKAKTRASVPAPNTRPSVSKLKAEPSISTAAITKTEDKVKEPVKEEPKKPKPTGKLNFFAPKAQIPPKEKGKEASSKNSAEMKGKMFFGAAPRSSAPTGKAKEAAPTSTLALAKESEKADPTKVRILTCNIH